MVELCIKRLVDIIDELHEGPQDPLGSLPMSSWKDVNPEKAILSMSINIAKILKAHSVQHLQLSSEVSVLDKNTRTQINLMKQEIKYLRSRVRGSAILSLFQH